MDWRCLEKKQTTDSKQATELQMGLIDLQCNEFIKSKFNEASQIDFYRKYVPSEHCPNLR